ncbi:uncharacterized protein G2W53_030227 [Senna tora]|uniref:Uncharacterized protein n=1 Tax=Senna tora TaxID=362788 RepID=A0A834WCQ1_9FABA|nr:uncharacterized protein G2W53_030227 [Senna tora]
MALAASEGDDGNELSKSLGASPTEEDREDGGGG